MKLLFSLLLSLSFLSADEIGDLQKACDGGDAKVRGGCQNSQKGARCLRL
jgi:hypothetical protein